MASHPPATVLQSGTRHQSPGQAHSSQSCPYQPPPASHRPRATCPPANQSCPYQPPPASPRPRVTCPPANQSCPSQVTAQPGLPCHPHACSQILTFRPLPIKPHEKIIGKGRFCLYLPLPVNACGCTEFGCETLHHPGCLSGRGNHDSLFM